MPKLKEDRPKKTILAVDDTPLSLHTLRQILGEEFNVVPAKDCETAWDIMQGVDIDLILLDIVMPNVTGLEFISMLHNTPKLTDIPVIFVSSLGTEETLRAAMNSGARDFVVKPVKSETLLKKVHAVLGE
jgi:PleD family two-component response regulator